MPFSEISIQRFLSVTVLVPMGRGSLEYGNAPAMRNSLAAPLTFAAAFCKPQKKLPPLAANAKDFRAHARPQPSQGSRRLSDLPGDFQRKHASPSSPARSDKRACLRMVEVEPELETPQYWPRHAAALPCFSQKARPYLNRPANGARSAEPSPDSSQHRQLGKKITIDKNLI